MKFLKEHRKVQRLEAALEAINVASEEAGNATAESERANRREKNCAGNFQPSIDPKHRWPKIRDSSTVVGMTPKVATRVRHTPLSVRRSFLCI
jgi:hypothetical protein